MRMGHMLTPWQGGDSVLRLMNGIPPVQLGYLESVGVASIYPNASAVGNVQGSEDFPLILSLYHTLLTPHHSCPRGVQASRE